MRWLYWAEVDETRPDLLVQAKEIMYFDLPMSHYRYSVRQRKEGDRILLPGMTNSKRLSRLFIDEKVGRHYVSLPVIVTKQDEVCAVPGLRYGASFTKNQTSD